MFTEKIFNNLTLRQSILATLAYFDTQKYPLTLMELQRYLFKHQSDLDELALELDKLIAEKKIIADKSFYFLPQKDNLANLRLKNYSNFSIKYWKTVRKAMHFLNLIPFLRFVGVCNNLAINNVNQESDIDLFLITDKNYLWLVRAMVVVILGLVGLRHYGHDKGKQNIAGKICLSFYTTEDNLNLQEIAKKPYDIYLTYWITQIVPVLNEKNLYTKFHQANLWVKNWLPVYPDAFNRLPDLKEPSYFTRTIKKINQFILAFGLGFILNKLARYLQLTRLKKSKAITKEHYQEKDFVVNDKMLRFYLNDQRKYFRDLFEKKLKELKII